MRVERREVPAGPRRDPSPQRRVLEGLRKVPQRQPVLAQPILQPRPSCPRLNPRRQRLRVDLQHPIQPPEVERDDRPIPQPRLNPPDHAGPAPERNHSRPLRLSPREHHLDLRLVPGKRHKIWRVRKFPPEPPHHIPIGLAHGMGDTLVALIREEVPQRRRRLQSGRPQLHILKRNGLLKLAPETKPLPDPDRSRLKLLPRRRLILPPPPPVLEPPSHESRSKAGRGPLRTGGYSKCRSN